MGNGMPVNKLNWTELLAARYGTEVPDGLLTGTDNPIVRAQLAHRSVRHYAPTPLPERTLELLVAAGQSAATSSNLQTWSLIAIEDVARKSEAATLCGDQEFIRAAPLFLVFCADLARLTEISAQVEMPAEGLNYLEMFLMATINASLAAQNVALAAEALGLGICYVGAARNQPKELSALLKLPDRVFALFGMTVGVPAENDTSEVKPRLPQPAVCHREQYTGAAVERLRWIASYDDTLRAFDATQHRSASGGWTRRSAKRVATVESLTGRHILREFLQSRGFLLK